MGVYWESTEFGAVRSDGIHGRSGIGLSELAFTLVWTLHPTRTDVFSIFGTTMWVSVQAEGDASPSLLGQAVPEAAWCDETRPFVQDGGRCAYRLILPSPQLLALEQLRQGRSLVFSLDIRGNSRSDHGIRRFNETLTLRVNVSDWIRILGEANAAEVLLVGVHLPAAGLDPKYRSAIELVRKANHHLIQGDFSVAVAECRRALESLWKAANLGTGRRRRESNLPLEPRTKKWVRRTESSRLAKLSVICATALIMWELTLYLQNLDGWMRRSSLARRRLSFRRL